MLRKNKIPMLASLLALLGGCANVASEYRAANRERVVLSNTDRPGKVIRVDILAAIDPLGLGRERVVLRQKKLGSEAVSSDYNKSRSTSPSDAEFTGSDLIENALLGFYDPRYPQMLCGDPTVPDGTSNGSSRPRDVCQGLLGRGTIDGKASPIKQVKQTVIKNIRTTEVTKLVPDNKGLKPHGKTEKSTEIISVKVDVAVDENRLNESSLEIFQRLRRNRIQDRLIHASQLNCDEYITNMRLLRSDSDAFFGTATLALQGAASIFANAAQVLGGIGAAVTGIGRATDKAYYNGITVPVIVAGIEKARATRLIAIRDGQNRSITSYTLQTALRDSAEYHGACTLEKGLREATETTKKAAEEEKDKAYSNPPKDSVVPVDDSKASKKPASPAAS